MLYLSAEFHYNFYSTLEPYIINSAWSSEVPKQENSLKDSEAAH
jgi:hypothetical protein